MDDDIKINIPMNISLDRKTENTISQEGSYERLNISHNNSTTSTKIDTIIHITVSTSKRAYLEDWLIRIYEVLITFKGFRARHVHILSNNDKFIEYAIILVFDDINLLNLWLTSSERTEKTNELLLKGIKIYTIGAYGSGISSDELMISDTISNKTIKVELSTTPKRLKLHDNLKSIPRPLPPPKWKLTIITISLIYITLLVVGIGGSIRNMYLNNLPNGVITFFTLLHVVPFAMYALIPLFMSIPIINYWLRIPRTCSPEEMHPIYALFDQGLKMFANKIEIIPIDILQRLDRLEIKIDKLRIINHNLNLELRSIKQSSELDSNTPPPNVDNNNNSIIQSHNTHIIDKKEEHILHQINNFISNKTNQSMNDNNTIDNNTNNTIDKDGYITMAVKHFIKWEYIYDFELWTNEIDNEMKKWPGYCGMIRIAPKSDEDPFINSLTWDSYSNLLAFAHSDIRTILLTKLEPMLEATSQAQIGQERVFKDAFSELFIPTGATVGNHLIYIHI